MTKLIKTIAITTAILGAAITTAHASETFTARFDYIASQSADKNLARFEVQAKKLCDAQMKAAGFRKSEGRFERRKCRKDIMAKAVKAAQSPALTAQYNSKPSGAIRTLQAKN